MAGTVRVEGLAGLQRAIRRIDRDAAKDLRAELKEIAEPVKVDAERLGAERIRNLTPEWQRMRIGVTQHGVYIVPNRRSRRGSRRPNLKTLLLDRAMYPALVENRAEVDRGLDRFLDHVERQWGMP